MKIDDTYITVDGYTLLKRPLEPPPHQCVELQQRDRLNAEFLAGIQGQPSGGRLSGSFIYAHSGGYRGRNTLNYGVAEWRGLFRELKELGMDTAVMSASAWFDYRECFYRSNLFKDFKTWNVLEPMLLAAGDENMRVFLGCIGRIRGERMIGAETGDEKMAKTCADEELACYRELLDLYKGAFHGYYLSNETGFWSWGNPVFLTRCFHAYFQRVTNGVKDITPDMPILSSPYTVRCPGRETEAVDTLTAVHKNCPFTVLAPQDSIGVTMNDLTFLDRGLDIWKKVCENIGAEFWTNCETFNIIDCKGPLYTIVPAEFGRLAVQLDAACRMGAKKIITWEAIHFMNPAGSVAARRLRSDYLRRYCVKKGCD